MVTATDAATATAMTATGRAQRDAFWYARGATLPAIERRLGGWHADPGQAAVPSWGLGRAFGVACAGIAACLNRRPQDYGLRVPERAPPRPRWRGTGRAGNAGAGLWARVRCLRQRSPH
jgi:hypothetical protein